MLIEKLEGRRLLSASSDPAGASERALTVAVEADGDVVLAQDVDVSDGIDYAPDTTPLAHLVTSSEGITNGGDNPIVFSNEGVQTIVLPGDLIVGLDADEALHIGVFQDVDATPGVLFGDGLIDAGGDVELASASVFGGQITNLGNGGVVIWQSTPNGGRFRVLQPGDTTSMIEDWDYALVGGVLWVKVRDGGWLIVNGGGIPGGATPGFIDINPGWTPGSPPTNPAPPIYVPPFLFF